VNVIRSFAKMVKKMSKRGNKKEGFEREAFQPQAPL